MRARGLIFVSTQKPFTIFGVPKRLFGLVGGVGVLVMLVGGSTMHKGLAFFLTVVVLMAGFIYVWKKNRQDCHYEQRLLLGERFFKGKRTRHLIPGRPRHKKKSKERPF